MVLIRLDNETVNVLGTDWDIVYADQETDHMLEYNLGYEDHTTHTIIIREKPIDPNTHDQEYLRKEVLRHELVHAFLDECGLAESSGGMWAVNEEMVDWIARVGPKLFDAWRKMDLLPPAPKRYEDMV